MNSCVDDIPLNLLYFIKQQFFVILFILAYVVNISVSVDTVAWCMYLFNKST
jgi:hypothetical protein